MKRESLKMTAEDWQQLTEVAASTGSIYSGQPSWRRLVLRIARGEVRCTAKATKRRSRKSENSMICGDSAALSPLPENDTPSTPADQ